MADAPLITDHLCDACRKHFEEVQELLSDVGVDFGLQPRLVRGLDYYTRTAFEWTAKGLGSQDAVGGGGRYDGLSEALDGPPLPGIGFALGIDRILLARGEKKVAAGALEARAAAQVAFRTLFLGLGAIALLVGGVGIANVMVISVLERRPEIGLRRAPGATKRHVRTQFLSE